MDELWPLMISHFACTGLFRIPSWRALSKTFRLRLDYFKHYLMCYMFTGLKLNKHSRIVAQSVHGIFIITVEYNKSQKVIFTWVQLGPFCATNYPVISH